MCVPVCVYCLPYHIGKPAGCNLSPATLAVFCPTVSSLLLHSFTPPLSGTKPVNITDSKTLG